MPVVTAQLDATTPFQIDRATGKEYFNFADGTQLEFNNATDKIAWMQSNAPTVEQARVTVVAQCLRADPLMDDIALWKGKKITINIEAATTATIVRNV